MTSAAIGRPELLRRGVRLEYLTFGWNIAEGLIALGAGMAAGSIALIGFGVDSFVETASGLVLTWRLSAGLGQRGRLRQRSPAAGQLGGPAAAVLKVLGWRLGAHTSIRT